MDKYHEYHKAALADPTRHPSSSLAVARQIEIFQKTRGRRKTTSTTGRRYVGQVVLVQPIPAYMRLSVDCLFLRSPSRVLYRTELIPRAPKGRRTRTPHP